MEKPKVAFFDFACCEGCQLAAIDLTPEELLDLLALVDIVEFREAISEQSNQYDIAIIEGSITRESDIPRLKKIRETAKLVITLGSCSTLAGINALKNFQAPSDYQNAVYPDAPTSYETMEAKAVHEIIPVDAFIPGCPIDTQEFLRVIKNLLLSKAPAIPIHPVCVECKRKENICVYEKGMQCLGPITREGCGARCPSNGGYCFGCRGLVPEPNINSQKDILMKYNLTFEQMLDQFKLFLERSREIINHD